MNYIQYMKPGSNFWQNLGDAIKYARSTSALDGGGAYYVTSQAKEDLREQGKEDEAKQIEKAEAVGTVVGAIAGLTLGKGVPLITKGISAFRTAFPKVATGIDLVLTADGIRNLATENGIQKTVNYAKDGNWGRAAASGTMDALDLLGGVGLVDDVIKVIPKIQDGYNFLKQFKGITGYDKTTHTYKFIKGQQNFGERLGSGAESIVYTHPQKPDQVLKVHMTVAPHGEYTLYGIRDAITAKNKIPHFNKEDYVGWVYNKNWKAFHPVYAQKKFDSNADLPLHYEEEAMQAANKLGVGISDIRFENTAKIGDEVFINDLSITGYPKTNKILPIEKYFKSVNRIKDGINRGIGNVRHKLYQGATKIVRNRLLKKIAKSSDLQQQISVMGRVFDTNPRIAPNPFFRQIEDSYPNFDKNLLDDLYNMYFDDRSGFFELLNSYKGKDTGSHTIIQLPNESNTLYIKSGGSIHIKKSDVKPVNYLNFFNKNVIK